MNIFDTPVTILKGVAKKRAETLSSLGINSIYDLINFLPSGYEDRRVFSNIEDLTDGIDVCLKATLKTSVRTVRVKSNLTISNCIIYDETGEVMVVWYNQRYIEKNLFKDNEYYFYGKIKKGKSRLELVNPKFDGVNNKGYAGKIVPVYPLLSKIPQKTFTEIMRQAVDYAENMLVNPLPRCVEEKYNLPDISSSLRGVHFPENEQQLIVSRRRFAFEEYFYFHSALSSIRKEANKPGIVFSDIVTESVESKLPFLLTSAQKKVINEVKSDVSSGKQMNRLVQGDVGSGKTAVAMITAAIAKQNGFCSVLIAPTEILAKQHYLSFSDLFPDYKISFLTSSISVKEKRRIYMDIQNGEVDILIGTHAVLEDAIEFPNLGLVIVDEQHRFGVRQRQKLIEKGVNPHLLVMTATPIPRTLSLIMFNDLDVSVIDSLPLGRKPVKTYLVGESYRERVYTFLQKEISNGGQAYIICPLVEENENYNLKDVVGYFDELKTKMPHIKFGILHGKMKDSDKNQIMDSFKNRQIDVLVSTTVVEVGVDVKNASLMIIENAERFGLSQLHQLRGRVGRGDKQSYCILIANTSNGDTIQRLKVIEKSNDGFYISEQDLKQRGPGDFLGTRQHGLPSVNMPDGESELNLLLNAKQAVIDISQKVLIPTDNELRIIKYMLNRHMDSKNNANILN